MSYLLEIVEGWTGSLPFTLKSDGVAQDLTGLTITAVLKDGSGAVVDTTSDVTVTGTTSGYVEYAPDAADFSASLSPYSIRFKATDTTGGIVYFPNDESALIKVRIA